MNNSSSRSSESEQNEIKQLNCTDLLGSQLKIMKYCNIIEHFLWLAPR